MAHGGKPDPIAHVVDSNHHNDEWVFFEEIFTGANKIGLPDIPIPYPSWAEGTLQLAWYPFQITKFMIIELIAAALVVVIFIAIARLAKGGKLPKGPFWNFFEGMLTFVRDNLAKPYLKEDADKFVPFLWTLFTFILFCNLLGLVPFLGSPTGSIYMTIGLAVYCLILFHGAAIAKLGLRRYLSSMWLHIEIVPHPLRKPGSGGHGHGHDDHGHGDHGHAAHAPTPAAHAHDEVPWTPPTGGKLAFGMVLYGVGWVFGNLISLLIFLIEFMGTFIRSVVLALRLFVNMFAGHVIIASILLLIVMVGNPQWGVFTWQGGLTTILAVLGVTGLSLLELFVAFLQAYVFTFLTALFLGMALHPAH